MEGDTICAISTPAGISGIALIRMSGPGVIPIIRRIFHPARKKSIENWPTHTVRYGFIIYQNRVLDEVLVTLMRKPRSYTREDMAEIGCHGGFTAARAVLNACLKEGARLAAAGEFTRRAFLHGRIDLAQAESVLEIVESRTEEALSLSLAKLRGDLSTRVSSLRKQTINLLTEIETYLNFPDEQFISDASVFLGKMQQILSSACQLRDEAGKGKLFVEGVRAAIVGKTNVGKSSLLNALLRQERALVTEIPGTTRDSLQEVINLKGIPLSIIDTAGFRKARGVIERMGVARAKEWMDKAEINILVLDASRHLTSADKELLQYVSRKKHLLVLNKCDLPQQVKIEQIKGMTDSHPVKISARTGAGLDRLEESLYNLLVETGGQASGCLYMNLRQQQLIQEVISHAENAVQILKNGESPEFMVDDLKKILQSLDGLTGQELNDEVLDRIFSCFCIGK